MHISVCSFQYTPPAVCGELDPQKEQAVWVSGESTGLRTLNQSGFAAYELCDLRQVPSPP